MSVWKSNEKLVIFASLNFIRLLRVVSPLSNVVTEGLITTRSNRMKFRQHFFIRNFSF